MEKKETGAFSLGGRGFLIVILSFISCYLYSALTSDSLNVTPEAFVARGVSQSLITMMPTVASVFGIIGSIIFGIVMNKKTAKFGWTIALGIIVVFALVLGNASSNATYAVGFIGCYVGALAAAQLLGYQVIAYWFPKKRGTAMGIATAGFPLSAATTAAVCGMLIGVGGGSPTLYFTVMACLALLTMILVGLFVKDFPEEVGAYPDNNKEFDFEAERKRHEENLKYLETSKWTVSKCLKTGRMWLLWVAIGATGFLSMGIMANFISFFMEADAAYYSDKYLIMLAVAGVLAIPGSMFVGWLDVVVGTKKAGILVNIMAAVAVALNLTNVHVLSFISLPLLAIMLGGSSNMMVSCTSAIWGRYDSQNALRVIQPLNSIFCAVGISVVMGVGNAVSFRTAFWVMLFIAIAGLISMCALKVEPIDDEVR